MKIIASIVLAFLLCTVTICSAFAANGCGNEHYVDGLRTTVLAGGSDWALFLSNVCLTRLYKTCIIAGAGKGRRANGRIGD